MDSDLENWNPMRDHYNDPHLNSYDQGPGRNLRCRQDNGDRTIKLYVTGWPDEMTEEGLRNLFSNQGKVLRVHKMKSRMESTGFTYGFVTVESVNDAEQIIAKYDGFRVQRFTLKVQIALSPEEKERRFKEKQERENFLQSLSSVRQDAHDSDDDVQVSEAEFARSSMVNGRHPAQSSRYRANNYQSHSTKKPSGSVYLPCTFCGNLGKFTCSRCKAPYCHKDCQAQDWPSHKLGCLGLDAVTSSEETKAITEVKKSNKKQHREEELNLDEFEVSIDDNLLKKCENLLIKEGDLVSPEDRHGDDSDRQSGHNDRHGDQKSRNGHIDPLIQRQQPSTKMRSDTSQNIGRVYFSDMTEVELKLDTPYEVDLAWAYNPKSFFVLLKNLKYQRNLLQTELNQFYSETTNVGAGSYTPTRNEVCAAQFSEDGNWYRARVDAINLDSTFELTYIDFGNAEQIPVTSLRKLAARFFELPVQAIQCQLAGVTPLNGSSWAQEVLQAFYEHLLSAKNIHVNFLEPISGSKVKDVTMTTDPGGKSVSLWLEDQGLTQTTSRSQPKSSSSKTGETRVKPDTASVSPQQSTGEEKDDIKIPPPMIPTMAKRLTNGKVYTVEVMHIDSPGQFWVLVQTEYLSEFSELTTALNEHYNTLKIKKGFTPTGSMLYAAKFTDDTWCRAQVYDFTTELASVVYLDYGNRMDVPFSWLHSLEGQFCSVPFQAVKCRLHGVLPQPGSCWSKPATELFSGLVTGKAFQASIVDAKSDPVIIELISDDCQNLSQILVEKKFAKTATQSTCSQDKTAGMSHQSQKSRSSPAHGSSEREFVPVSCGSDGRNSAVSIRSSGDSFKSTSPYSSDRASPAGSEVQRSAAANRSSPSSGSVGQRSPAANKDSPVSPTSQGRMMCRDLVRKKLKKDVVVRAVISDAPSPNQVTVQVLTEENNIAMQALNTMLGSVAKESYVPVEGELVKAQFMANNTWYRAEVLQVDGQKVCVRFVDFGNCEETSIERIARSDQELMSVPCVGVKCQLAGVLAGDKWSPSVLQEKICCVTAVGCSSGVYKIKLHDLDSGQDVMEQLVSDGVLILDQNLSASKVNSPPALKSIALEHLGKVGESITVTVCYVVTAKEIYVQRLGSDTAIAGVLADMLAEFGMLPDGKASYAPRVGEIVAAYCGDDAVWHRARVLSVSDTKVCVFHIDYGSRETVTTSHVRNLQKLTDCFSLPAQGIKVSLGAPDAVFNQAVSVKLKELLLDQECSVTVKSVSESGCELSKMKLTEKPLDVLDFLQAEGLVCSSKTNVKPSTGSSQQASVEKPSRSTPPTKIDDIPRIAVPESGAAVKIAHAISPSDFYIIRADTCDMKQCLVELNDACKKDSKPYRPTCAGEVVAALFDDLWYRAVVMKKSGENKFLVSFIDFGNEEVLPIPKIRKLPPSSVHLHQQAIHCAMGGLQGTETDGKWSEHAIELFKEIGSSPWELRPTGKIENSKHLVDLYSNEALNTLSELLVADEFAVRIEETPASSKPQQSLESSVTREENQRSNAAPSPTPQPTKQPQNTSSKPAMPTTCKPQQKTAGASKKKSPGSQKTYKGPRFLVSQLPREELPESLQVLVIHVESPNQIYCQQAVPEVMKALEVQQVAINEYCNTQKTPPTGYTPNIGELCLAFVKDFSEWYRVDVKEQVGSEYCLHCVDFGSEATVSVDKILPCPAKFLLNPRMACCCSLAGISPAGDDWTNSAKEIVAKLTHEKLVDAQLIESHDDSDDDDVYFVELSVEGKSLSKHLLSEGLALKEDGST